MQEEWFTILKDSKNFDRYKKDIAEMLKQMQTLMDTEYPNKANISRLQNLTKDITGAINLMGQMVEQIDSDERIADEIDPSRKRRSSEMSAMYGEFGWKPDQEGTTGGGF